MSTKINLKQIILNVEEIQNGNIQDSITERFLQSGLQEILTLLISIYSVAIIKNKKIPDGFTGRFEKTFTKPVLGVLIQFLLWLSQQEIDPEILTGTSESLIKYGKKGNSWLNTLITSRNRWVHANEKNKDIIIKEVKELLGNIPDWMQSIEFEYENRDLYFVNDNIKTLLSPLISYEQGNLTTYSEFKALYNLEFETSNEDSSIQSFSEIWQELRIIDNKLEAPSMSEFILKAKKAYLENKYSGKTPKWIESIIGSKEPGLIIDPKIIDGILLEMDLYNSNMTPMDIILEDNELPADKIAIKTGIKNPLTSKELLDFTSTKNPMLIVLRADSLSSKEFLKMIYWLADLKSSGKTSFIRILLCRSEDKLKGDQETLWDRLPGNIDDLLKIPFGSKGEELSEYLWKFKTKKKFLGIF